MIYYFCEKSKNTAEGFPKLRGKILKSNYLLVGFFSGYFTTA